VSTTTAATHVDTEGAQERTGYRAVLIWALAFFAAYAYYSLANHHRFGTAGWDLGIFAQAVDGYAHLHGPVADVRGWGFNLYGDHFHPIIAALVPLYWLHPKATTLLVAQAALLAWSIIPIGRLAVRRMGNLRGQAVTVAYGLAWGIQAALSFDFHEVAFAAPLLAYALVAFVEERWRTGVAWTLPLLLVKEEMALVVVAIGLYLLWRRRWWAGAGLALAGAVTFVLVVFVLIPHVNPDHLNPYVGTYQGGQDGQALGERLRRAPLLLFNNAEKRDTLFRIGVVTGFLALRSPLWLLVLPTLTARFLSPLDFYWSSRYHYSLIFMPILFVAFLDAYPKLLASRWRFVRGYTERAAAIVLTAAIAMAQLYPLKDAVLSPVQSWRIDPPTAAAYRMMARIPDGALVETTNHVAPHLTHRCRVYLWPVVQGRHPDWVLTDPDDAFHATPDDLHRHLRDLIAGGYEVVAAADGYWLLRRR
jgi:uncharacterized membrane protein